MPPNPDTTLDTEPVKFDPASSAGTLAGLAAELCENSGQQDPRFWERLDDPGKTPDDYRNGIRVALEHLGIDPKDHSRALGHIFYETDTRVLAGIYHQLNEVVRGWPNPTFDLPAHEGMEKATWSIAALALGPASLARTAAFQVAVGPKAAGLVTGDAQAPCNGYSVPTLENLSEDYKESRGGIRSPTLTAALESVLPAIGQKFDDFLKNRTIETMSAESDPALANDLIDFNIALRDAYLKRKWPSQESCTNGMTDNSNLCASQFALASGGSLVQATPANLWENGVKTGHYDQLTLAVKFGKDSPEDLAKKMAQAMMGDLMGIDPGRKPKVDPEDPALNAPDSAASEALFDEGSDEEGIGITADPVPQPTRAPAPPAPGR